MPNHFHVQKIEKIYSSDEGCTRPAQVILDNGNRAILKYPHNQQGIIVLVNEYVSYELATAIELSVPNFGTAVVDDQTILCDVGNVNLLGVGFYSQYIANVVPISSRTVKRASNLDERCRLILLDAIVKNSDRHTSNVLIGFEKSDLKLYSIDFSHAFGDPHWNCNSLVLGDFASPYVWRENVDLYQLLLQAPPMILFEQLVREKEHIQACITDALLDKIFDEIPGEWRQEVGVGHLDHLKKYIQSKIVHLDEICATIHNEGGI